MNLAVRYFFLLVCLLPWQTSICSERLPPVLGIQTAETEKRLRQGRVALLNLRFGAADQQFHAIGNAPDGRLAAITQLALSGLVRAVVLDQPTAYRAYLARLDSLEKDLRSAPNGVWKDYAAAELALDRTLALGLSDRNLPAAMAARSAYAGFTRLVKEHPDCYEAYTGLGLLHLAIGSLPGGYRGVLRFLGYRGSVEGGLAELRMASAKARYSNDVAAVALPLTDVLLFGEPERGVTPFEALMRRYPESPLLKYLYGVVLLKSRRATEADRAFTSVARSLGAGGTTNIRFLDYYQGRTAFLLGRYADSERYYRAYLARAGGPSLRAAAIVGIGQDLEMLGRRDLALRRYRQVHSDRDLDGDAAAVREAAVRIRFPLTGVHRILFLARNHYDAGHYSEATALLNPLLQDRSVAGEDRAEAAYRLGRTLHAQDRTAPALEAYAIAASTSRNPDLRWAPWSHFYRGTLFADAGDSTAATAAFKQALAWKGNYDYHQTLEQAAKAWLVRLR